MINIKLMSIFVFVYILCVYYHIFFKNIINVSIPINKFQSSFKPINGYNWETSDFNIILLIKLLAIILLAKYKNISIFNILLYIFSLETLLLFSINNSSFILHSLVSFGLYFLFKNIYIIIEKNKKIKNKN